MSTKTAKLRTAETVARLTTDPDKAQPFTSPSDADNFASRMQAQFGGSWVRVLSKKICVMVIAAGSPVRHYYSTDALLDPAPVLVPEVAADVVPMSKSL